MAWFWKPISFFQINILYLFAVIILSLSDCEAETPQYHFVVKEARYTRLCSSKNILTVNGEFPGPTLRARKGDTIFVMVHNKGKENITIHWHGVKQPRNPWSDGPEYITQCPIQPGNKFNQKIVFSTEEGTIWWHAHSDWSRATVHGAIIVHPKHGTHFPFKKPIDEFPIILGEWWKKGVRLVLEEFQRSGGSPNVSDALTINGQPGDLYNCSSSGTVKFEVESNKRYLLRVVNAAMNTIMFFAVAHHNVTVIGSDGGYTKHVNTKYITISPGQTMDVLFVTNQHPGLYYMAARAYSSGVNVEFDNTTTTAILEYKEAKNMTKSKSKSRSSPLLPYLPYYNDTNAAYSFITRLRSLASKEHPVDVPTKISRKIVSTVSINTFPCPGNRTCEGPNGTRLAASMNNISFVLPTSVDVLEAYYYHIHGVYKNGFPRLPPYMFNFTAEYLPLELQTPKRGTKVVVLPHGSLVEMVFQGTNLLGGLDHPMHLHGYNFFVVGYGFGNFDEEKDKLGFNLVDPPFLNTVIVPRNGWAVIRFAANNPGVWFMHCHLERHLTWGMNTVFIVKNGKTPNSTLKPPPPDMPPC